jgi:hypothetical protein
MAQRQKQQLITRQLRFAHEVKPSLLHSNAELKEIEVKSEGAAIPPMSCCSALLKSNACQ